MVKTETQVITIEHLIDNLIKSYQLPEDISVISVDHLLDPVKGKVVLTIVFDDNSAPAEATPEAEAE